MAETRAGNVDACYYKQAEWITCSDCACDDRGAWRSCAGERAVRYNREWTMARAAQSCGGRSRCNAEGERRYCGCTQIVCMQAQHLPSPGSVTSSPRRTDESQEHTS